MLVELYIFWEIVLIVIFFLAFFSKQEICWALTVVISGILMIKAYNVQVYIYEFNTSLGAYQAILINNSYPYLMGINLLFFGLAVALGLFDLFDKYGVKLKAEDPIVPYGEHDPNKGPSDKDIRIQNRKV